LPKQTIILNNLKRLARRLELVQTNIGHPLVIKKGLSIPHLDEMEELHASGQAVDLYCNSAEQQKARLDEDWNGGYGQAENWCHLDISPNLERWET
jgi:hypothetical protein